jgi:transposase
VVRTAYQQEDERIAWLEAENVVLRINVDEVSADNAKLLAELHRVSVERDGLAAKVEALTAKVVELTKQVFGSRSERAKKKDGDIVDADAWPADRPQGEATPEPTEAPEQKRKRGQQPRQPGHGRRDYGNLARTERVHEPDPELLVCPFCGTRYAPFKEERSEEIDVEVVVSVVVHVRPTYHRGCSCKGTKGIVAAPPPAKVIPKGRLSAGFLAHLVVAKFLLGLPITRVCAGLAMEGASFAPSSLVGALRSLCPLLSPLASAIRSHNAASPHLHMDETSWKVFEVTKGKTGYRWWCWIFVGNDTTAFVIKPGKGADVAAEHLGIDLDAETPMLPGGETLLASSDFATCYQRLGRTVEGFVNIFCWAHIRRYFIRAGAGHLVLKAWADAWVALIAELFIAHRAWGIALQGSKEEALALVEVRAVIGRIDARRVAEGADPDLHPAARKVLATLDHEWKGLIAFLGHPGIPLDNNRAERGLRRPVVIRKNCYGSGSAWSAGFAADAWTILATASQNHLNPLAYLKAYLLACAEARGKAPEGAALERFFPWALSKADQSAWADTS